MLRPMSRDGAAAEVGREVDDPRTEASTEENAHKAYPWLNPESN
jgi:hypothetical protein